MSGVVPLDQLKLELGDAKLIAVSKRQPIEKIEQAYGEGQRHFGENRVEELWDKANSLAHLEGIQWHFIGQLQSKKIKKLLSVENLTHIHSLYRADQLEKFAQSGKQLKVFVQMNLTGETEKQGLDDLEEAKKLVGLIEDKENIQFLGLMGMATFRTEQPEEEADRCFRTLREYKEELEKSFGRLELSMGMSGDYKIALKNGSDWVRIGSKIFGPRD